MLVLLPPSEGKADAGTRRPVDTARLALPALAPARERVLSALVELCTGDGEAAAAALGLPAGLRAEVRRNAGLRAARTATAADLYTGVLFAALDLPGLPPAAYRQAGRQVLIFSGLWGVVRPDDRIPPYRCAVTARLPGIGGLAAYWRGVLGPVLAEAAGGGPVLDLRSTGYVGMWSPDGDLARRTVAVRVLQERVVDGAPVRSVVSHFNKATKGRLVRDLLTAGARPRSAPALITALRGLGYRVEERPVGAGRARQLDVVVSDL